MVCSCCCLMNKSDVENSGCCCYPNLFLFQLGKKNAGHLQNAEQQKSIWIKVTCLEIIIMEVLLQESERLRTIQMCFSVLML